MIDTRYITGLVLAGGRGSRMGGADKGLQLHQGRALALHALQRLAPQVGALAVNANRHAADYAAFGVPVWPDTVPGQPGPLAGLLAGLERCGTEWLASVPCDAPHFPADLVQRLAAGAADAGADLALAATVHDGALREQPVFCLLRRTLRDSLQASLAGGQRQVLRWALQQRAAVVRFDDPTAFANLNTLQDLQAPAGPADATSAPGSRRPA